MDSLRVRCNAKVNLYLKVLSKRDDGFHEIETIYHTVSLSDQLNLVKKGSGITLRVDHPDVPCDDTNLAAQAAKILAGGKRYGLEITIEKGIPVSAGLGGGSADAAGVLIGAPKLLGLSYSMDALESMAEKIGSDVKFLLRGGCAIGRGRGEKLDFLPSIRDYRLLVVVPPIKISTAWAYQSLKLRLTTHSSLLTIISSALERGDFSSLWNLLYNDFERLICAKYPIVGRIKNELLDRGAVGALMTGTGPAVYGIFEEGGDVESCRRYFENQGLDVHPACFLDRGVTTLA